MAGARVVVVVVVFGGVGCVLGGSGVQLGQTCPRRPRLPAFCTTSAW